MSALLSMRRRMSLFSIVLLWLHVPLAVLVSVVVPGGDLMASLALTVVAASSASLAVWRDPTSLAARTMVAIAFVMVVSRLSPSVDQNIC